MFTAKRTTLALCTLLLTLSVVRTDDQPRSAEQGVAKAIAEAIKKGQDFLKGTQREGQWEHQFPGIIPQTGGVSALALLALVESGLGTDDKVVRDGLAFLRKQPPKSTYTVALQTAVLARAEPRKDKALLERNVKWLLDTAKAPAHGTIAWGYPNEAAAGPDNSNTQFAVLALNAAARAGIDIPAETWQRVRRYYLDTQLPTGGWSYPVKSPRTERLTMTSAAVFALGVVSQHDKGFPAEAKQALDNGVKRMGETFRIRPGGAVGSNLAFVYYNLYGIRRAGVTAGQKTFSDSKGNLIDWYRDGSRFLLDTQQENGRWQGSDAIDGNPVIATSFALLFLATDDGVRK
jgi:hypothetical protein